MATLFTDGSVVTFGVPDSPYSSAIAESVNYTKNTKVVRIYDATGYPTGKTVVLDFGEFTAKMQLTSTTGPTINNGTTLNVMNNTHTVMVVKAGSVYTQGAYAYQNIEGVDQVNSITV